MGDAWGHIINLGVTNRALAHLQVAPQVRLIPHGHTHLVGANSA